MKIILSFILMTSLLFPVGGVVIFNDGTTIEGNVIDVGSTKDLKPESLILLSLILLADLVNCHDVQL